MPRASWICSKPKGSEIFTVVKMNETLHTKEHRHLESDMTRLAGLSRSSCDGQSAHIALLSTAGHPRTISVAAP